MNKFYNNLKIIFSFAKPESIDDETIDNNFSLCHNYISQTLYSQIGKMCFFNNSENELIQYYNQLIDMKYSSFFELITDFGESTIDISNGYPQIRFNKIEDWYEITHYIGQAVIITSLMAKKTLEYNVDYSYFGWPSNLRTDNRQLQHILNSGIAENHFHLNGSAEIFPITWISIMNNPSLAINKLEKIAKNLFPLLSYGVNDNRQNWVSLLLEAARIRINLFCKIHPEYKGFEINNSLKTHKLIQDAACNLSSLNGYRDEKYGWTLDYALGKNLSSENLGNNRILVGERIFLFDCFKSIFCGRFDYTEKNMFYKYLLIKNNFRNEIVQNNNITGFKNFSDYQKRKFYFIKGIKKYENEAFITSINEALSNEPIISLEARIMPQKKATKLASCIKKYDQLFAITNNKIEQDHDLPYFFVLHYPKGEDKLCSNTFNQIYRNAFQRKSNKLYSLAIMKALINHPELQSRILGIDTCSNEIGCRPEVFATDYRYLKEFVDIKTNHIWNELPNKHFSLGRTYHVGEDFLDIADGLRAIDEVINFLEFSYGDRLGHALALGIDPQKYYNIKGKSVVLPCIDLLDNLVWLYNKSNELNIDIEPILKQKLERTIIELADKIYGNFKREHIEININSHSLYCSWQLRGDHPELYKNMRFEPPKLDYDHYNKAMFKNINHLNVLRQHKDYAYLYFAYHFDESVKIAGRKPYEFFITPEYISFIIDIQKKMQFEVAKLGIMIECNPSSNKMIGTFREYKNHPITVFNNLHLEKNPNQISQCPQISVSINTDDQGIFDTSLEYEYALMANALMNEKNYDGDRMYSPSQIYDYLESVRKMGIIQSFKLREKNNIFFANN